jgi:hypothetical protein
MTFDNTCWHNNSCSHDATGLKAYFSLSSIRMSLQFSEYDFLDNPFRPKRVFVKWSFSQKRGMKQQNLSHFLRPPLLFIAPCLPPHSHPLFLSLFPPISLPPLFLHLNLLFYYIFLPLYLLNRFSYIIWSLFSHFPHKLSLYSSSFSHLVSPYALSLSLFLFLRLNLQIRLFYFDLPLFRPS